MLGARHARGFTLIEILAVVAILALVAGFIVPNMGGLRRRALRNEAQQIASQLELARQRAIVTGVPHRLWLELDEAEYRLEWLAMDPADAALDELPAEPPELDLAGNTPLDLSAPPARVLEYRPVPGNFGSLQVVADPFYFEAVETSQGRIDRGQVAVEFGRDGTAEDTSIYLEDAQGDRVALDIHPLDERVQVRNDDL
jgi:prepilin-type N-terminal cleavage/methylation domain-containing protein